MSTKPSTVATWGGTILTPSAGKQAAGFVPSERPPAQYLDWLFNLAGQWQQYLSDGNLTGAFTFGSTVGITGLLTASAGITVPTGQAVALQGTTTLTVGTGTTTLGGALAVTGAATFNGGAVLPIGQTATLNGDLVCNGNVTAGDTSGDTFTVNATSSIAGPLTFNNTATIAAGKTLVLTSGAGAIKNASTTKSIPVNFNDCTFVTGSAGGGVTGLPGISIPASSTYLYALKLPPSSHETITNLAVVFSAGSVANVASVTLKYVDLAYVKTNITGLTFTLSGQTYVMSGSPSVTLDGTSGRVYLIEVAANGSGAAVWLEVEMTVTT